MVAGADLPASIGFRRFRVLLQRREMIADGTPIKLGGSAFDILMTLIKAHGAVVSRSALMAEVWPGRVIEEHNLESHISALRTALGPDRDLIRTVSGRGYQFIGEIRALPEGSNGHTGSAAAGLLPPTNVPEPVSELIGRDDELAEVVNLMSAHRLVTLTGTGGIGKTRLAVALARELQPHFADGVWLVQLSPLGDPALVPSTVATTVGAALRGEPSVRNVAQALAGRRSLLVLDTCEHVIEVAASLAEAVLGAASELRILATSREALRAEGEWIFSVPALAVPTADVEQDDFFEYGAIRLFLERARAADPRFAPDRAPVQVIAAICRQLDGIPLAIELAAARMPALGLGGLAAHLDDRFSLLTGGRRTALPRHRTLRAVLDWSFELLSEVERELLRRLAIFAGPFSLEAVAAVAAETMTANEYAGAVADLVSKSLVVSSGDLGTPEFRLLETTRAYALDRLHENGVFAEVAHRHADFFLAVLAHVDEKRQSRPADEYLPVFRRYTDEVHAALEWAFSAAGDPVIGVATTIAAVPLWFALFQMMVARVRLEQALQYAEHGSDDEMRLRIAMGHVLWYTHIGLDIDTLEQNFTRALEIAEQIGAKDVQMLALWGLWAARRGRRDYPAALEMARRFGNAAESNGNVGAIHLADRILGLTYHFLGNQPLARKLTERALRKAHHLDSSLALGYQVETPVAMAAQLARILWVQGFPDQAMVMSAKALTAAREVGHPQANFYALAYAGVPVALWIGDLAEASHRAERLIALTTGNPRTEQWGRVLAGVIELRKEGSERSALITSFVEPRVDLFSTIPLARMLSERSIPVPAPEQPAEVLWNTPELLRVDAELLLWHNLPGAAVAAEAKLLRALEIARAQAALSWEPRTAMSLARSMLNRGQPELAKQLLAPVFRGFTEGFDTADLKAAKGLLDQLQ